MKLLFGYLQESNLQSTLSKTNFANPNNCYVVCVSLANSQQVIMPMKTEVNSGTRMLSPFSQHHDVRICPPAFVGNLPSRMASPALPLVVPSACNAPTDGMAGSLQDRSKVVAVVSPFKNSTDDYQSDGSELTSKFFNVTDFTEFLTRLAKDYKKLLYIESW